MNTYKMNITHLYSLLIILTVECLKPGSVQATDDCQDMEASLQCYSDNWESLQCFFMDSGAPCMRNVSMKVNHHNSLSLYSTPSTSNIRPDLLTHELCIFKVTRYKNRDQNRDQNRKKKPKNIPTK